VKRQEAAGAASAAACAAFLQQMGYREYARYLSYHFPFTHERSLLEHLRAAPWRFDQSMFKARAAPPCPGAPAVRCGCVAVRRARAQRVASAVPRNCCALFSMMLGCALPCRAPSPAQH